jgi:hypothetical protein
MKRELRRHYRQEFFAPNADFKGRSSLLPLRMADEEYKALDATFSKTESLLEAEDAEMPDAPDDSVKDECWVPSSKAEHASGQGRSPESTARSDKWNAINISASTAQPEAGTTNGSSSGYHSSQISPAMMGPHQSPGVGQQVSESSSTSPAMTPSSFAAPQIPQFQPWQPSRSPGPATTESGYASEPIKAAQPGGASWTAEQSEAWLKGLETKFGGDDVVLFVEGRDLKSCASLSSGGGPGQGWLKLIWTKSPSA